MKALAAHAGASRSDLKTGAGQDSAQAPQNVHSPREKSTSGKPPSPVVMMDSGQRSAQAPHREHAS
jgi:hypothetical protein